MREANLKLSMPYFDVYVQKTSLMFVIILFYLALIA